MTLVLDAGALIDLEHRGDHALALLEVAKREGEAVIVPATVLAQVWRGGPQAEISRVLRTGVSVPPLDEPAARAVGALLGLTGTRDVVDGHVAVLARYHGAVIVTSDPDDLRRLDPRATLHVI